MSGAPESPQVTSSNLRSRKLGRGLASLMANTRLASPDEISPPRAAPAPVPGAAGRYEPRVSAGSDGGTLGKPLKLPVDRIQPNPHQPRRAFDASQIAQLAESIRAEGLLQPLLVSPKQGDENGSYILIAGERRLRASKLAGLTEVPCVIRQASHEQLLQWALIENIQRSDLNPVDRAVAYRDFMDRFGASQQQLAERMGEPRSTIANYLRILDLCDFAQTLVADGRLSFGHAKVLAVLAGQEGRQKSLAKRVAEEGLSVRQLEELLGSPQTSQLASSPGQGDAAASKSQHIQNLERQLSQTVGTRVTIRPGRRKHFGKVIVEYYSLDDFDRITASLGAKLES